VLIGYARVSTGDQDLALQLDALKAAGCARWFSDTASGSLTERPQLKRALEELRDGEDTLVVWRLDRLGRSLRHLIELIGELERRQIGFRSLTEGIDTTTSSGRLVFHIFGAIAEFERQLIRERTQAGLKAARARGRLGGRRTVITDEKLRVARDMLAGGQHTMQQIADTIGVGRATLYRHLDHRPSRKAPSLPTSAPSAPAQPAVRSDQAKAPTGQQEPTLAGRAPRRAAPKKTAKSAGLPRRRWVGLVADRRLWLQETCPTCQASPGGRCRHPRALRKTRLPTTELHFARGWRQRPCPTCHAQPGEGCFTPRGRSAARPHSARLRASFGELTRGEAWEELQRCGANIATLPFTGERRTGARYGPTRLERLENDQLIEIETWSEQRSGDALIEALKAPVVARFASFLGQPPIRATLTWTVPDRRITINGKRGDQPFEEVIS
jgi:DNA invertase Pin-like site-specific DNA recombinase